MREGVRWIRRAERRVLSPDEHRHERLPECRREGSCGEANEANGQLACASERVEGTGIVGSPR